MDTRFEQAGYPNLPANDVEMDLDDEEDEGGLASGDHVQWTDEEGFVLRGVVVKIGTNKCRVRGEDGRVLSVLNARLQKVHVDSNNSTPSTPHVPSTSGNPQQPVSAHSESSNRSFTDPLRGHNQGGGEGAAARSGRGLYPDHEADTPKTPNPNASLPPGTLVKWQIATTSFQGEVIEAAAMEFGLGYRVLVDGRHVYTVPAGQCFVVSAPRPQHQPQQQPQQSQQLRLNKGDRVWVDHNAQWLPGTVFGRAMAGPNTFKFSVRLDGIREVETFAEDLVVPNTGPNSAPLAPPSSEASPWYSYLAGTKVGRSVAGWVGQTERPSSPLFALYELLEAQLSSGNIDVDRVYSVFVDFDTNNKKKGNRALDEDVEAARCALEPLIASNQAVATPNSVLVFALVIGKLQSYKPYCNGKSAVDRTMSDLCSKLGLQFAQVDTLVADTVLHVGTTHLSRVASDVQQRWRTFSDQPNPFAALAQRAASPLSLSSLTPFLQFALAAVSWDRAMGGATRWSSVLNSIDRVQWSQDVALPRNVFLEFVDAWTRVLHSAPASVQAVEPDAVVVAAKQFHPNALPPLKELWQAAVMAKQHVHPSGVVVAALSGKASGVNLFLDDCKAVVEGALGLARSHNSLPNSDIVQLPPKILLALLTSTKSRDVDRLRQLVREMFSVVLPEYQDALLGPFVDATAKHIRSMRGLTANKVCELCTDEQASEVECALGKHLAADFVTGGALVRKFQNIDHLTEGFGRLVAVMLAEARKGG